MDGVPGRRVGMDPRAQRCPFRPNNSITVEPVAQRCPEEEEAFPTGRSVCHWLDGFPVTLFQSPDGDPAPRDPGSLGQGCAQTFRPN